MKKLPLIGALAAGVAIGPMATAVAYAAWQFLDSSDWQPQVGVPGAFVRSLKGGDQMRAHFVGGEATYSVKMQGGPACSVVAQKGTPLTLITMAPSGESYAATIGAEIRIGWHGPSQGSKGQLRRLLNYESYVGPNGRECWLNRAREEVCK